MLLQGTVKSHWDVYQSYFQPLNSNVGTMAYPSLACGGELTLRRINTQSIELSENLTYMGRCINRGTVVLQPISSN